MMVLLFDGPCTLCNKSVQWVYNRDTIGRFKFAPLQGRWSQEHLPDDLKSADAVVLWDGSQYYTASSALIKVVLNLPWPWKLLAAFWLLPKPLRDFMYYKCARRRYLLFGTGYCALVPKDRLLE
jgi:predicted DCC family thiol-disulfide oxidoreductase YuxK